ncbi:hypothetical protein GOV05_03010 [Candidatus Woesearchaeota archaeon]|nr:hypothetical protein [Candidatus Woesearchaeota archaeon]
MDWNEIKVLMDGKEVCTATRQDGKINFSCTEDCMKACKDFKGRCC